MSSRTRLVKCQYSGDNLHFARDRSRKPPSPTWKAFLNNHVRDLVSIDFFVVPTVRFKVLFVLVILAHHRRRVVHFNVTEHPTAQWTGQQIIEVGQDEPGFDYAAKFLECFV